MQAFFGFLAFIALIAMIVGLIKPKLILPKAEKPSRLAAFGAATMALFVVVGVGLAVTPSKPVAPVVAATPQPAVTKAAEAIEVVAIPEPEVEELASVQYAAGIGISRVDAITFFTGLGFAQEFGTLRDGRERYTGKVDTAISEVIGPKADVEAMTLIVFMSTDDGSNMVQLGRMGAFLEYLFPGWTGGLAWVGDVMKSDATKARTTRNGRVLEAMVGRSLGMLTLTVKAEG